MSISIMKTVWDDENLKPTQKLIMLALADNANDDGVCYPFIESICNKTSLGRTSVVSNLKKLEDSNYLHKTIRSRKKGGRYSNIYLLYPLENYSKLDDDYNKYFIQSSPDGTIYENSQSSPDGTKFDSQSSPDGTKLTIVEPSLIIETSLIESAKRIAEYLSLKIMTVNPNFDKDKSSGWIVEIERAIRIDGRTESQLIGCINWIYSKGKFWIPNIMSGKKLREKYIDLETRMISDKNTCSIDFGWMEKLEAENAS